ncbi:hypothetical protein J2X04_002837 [Lysobacter niabensis]|uniref:Uncharacterized protein n=1 Tax=Agrilutibacter niabensis TaxID=380628 RepID=A0ABU1VSI7_9GAMM|nr:hypothetical protein [Lysobacter niabensis]MDR7100456.1 hypothetical protein [Lysobacter niabensis]
MDSKPFHFAVYTAVCATAFIALTHLGLALQDELSAAVVWLGVPKLVLLTDAATIHTLWVGTLSVHAAVGAVAPILGYTLLTTNISSASRIAPGGAVVALEIKWSEYLKNSLALLAGSIAGLLSAPSALGLVAAAGATAYVLLRTLGVFKSGFELIERPERFDASARQYLADAIAKVDFDVSRESASAELKALNHVLEELIPRAPSGHVERVTLRLGDPFRPTQFLGVAKRGVETLRSEAEKLGYRLYAVRAPLIARLPRGKRGYFSVERVEQAERSTSSAPAIGADLAIEPAAVKRLQTILEESISYGPSQWVDDITRMPMLIQRHVATVIYEAIPNQRPHDLAYGLDVLGQLIDSVQDIHRTNNPFGLDEFDWVYDIPLFVSNQIGCVEHSRMLYARELADFLRARLAKWLSEPELDQMSAAYIRLLAQLLRSFLPSDASGAEYIALVIREIPAFVGTRRVEALALIQRALILVLVDKKLASIGHSKDRRMIVRTISEVLRYSPSFEKSLSAQAETLISALAVPLFLAEGDDAYKAHVSDVLGGLFEDRYSELPFSDLLETIPRISEINERWKWSWWELDQKERGQAHFMSMDLWLTRAAAVALARESWRLKHMDDREIPNEQTLGALLRAVGSEDGWVDLLPDLTAQSVKAMVHPLQELLERRQAIVRNQVAMAPLSPEKLGEFVSQQMNDVKRTLVHHNEWLRDAGVIDVDDRLDETHQAGVNRLLPREWFVSDEALDIPIVVTGTHVGQALVDFEIKRVLETLKAVRKPVAETSSATDMRIWEHVHGAIDRGVRRLLIIGAGISEYDSYAEYARARDHAKDVGAEIRFESVRQTSELGKGVLVLDVANGFRIVRKQPVLVEMPLYREVLPLTLGGAVSDLIEISSEMQQNWTREMTEADAKEALARYANSVLSRTVWSFLIQSADPNATAFFSISEAESDAEAGEIDSAG